MVDLTVVVEGARISDAVIDVELAGRFVGADVGDGGGIVVPVVELGGEDEAEAKEADDRNGGGEEHSKDRNALREEGGSTCPGDCYQAGEGHEVALIEEEVEEWDDDGDGEGNGYEDGGEREGRRAKQESEGEDDCED